MNIGKYVQMYSEDLKLKNYSKNTIENYCSQVRLFLEYFNSVATKPSEISEKQIKAWLLLQTDVISSLTIEDVTKIVNAFTDINIPIEAVKEEIELNFL